jgi:hypothetical protein
VRYCRSSSKLLCWRPKMIEGIMQTIARPVMERPVSKIEMRLVRKFRGPDNIGSRYAQCKAVELPSVAVLHRTHVFTHSRDTFPTNRVTILVRRWVHISKQRFHGEAFLTRLHVSLTPIMASTILVSWGESADLEQV